MESRDLSRRKVVSGQFPQCGAIFMSNRSTLKQCFEKRLFGLPVSQLGFVTRVKAGMILFLFEFEKRELYGVFEAISDGGMNIVPQAYVSSGRWFPAQVKITTIWGCDPLLENGFCDAIKDNYYTTNKFNFGLSMDQVSSLLWLFSSRKLQIPKSLHHNKRKNTEQVYKYVNGELKKGRFTKIDIPKRWRGRCVEPEVERHLSSDFCKTCTSIPSDSDAYDPDHPGFLHPDDSEAHSASGHGLSELLTMQEKKDNFYISSEDTEDYVPLFSPDHSDIEEEGFDLIEYSEEKQIEFGAFVGNEVPFIQKRTSVFMRLSSASYTVSHEVHCLKSMKKGTNVRKKTNKKFNFSECEYYDKVDRSQEMLARASEYNMQGDDFEDVCV